MSPFEKYYRHVICHDLIHKQNISNIMELSSVSHLVVSSNFTLSSVSALELICHQKAKPTRARRAVANFKIRQNQLIGCKIILRKTALFYFLEKLAVLILPREREWKQFSSLHKSYSTLSSKRYTQIDFGLSNLLLFPELEDHYDFFESINGINITIAVSKGRNNLLTGFQLPLYKIPSK